MQIMHRRTRPAARAPHFKRVPIPQFSSGPITLTITTTRSPLTTATPPSPTLTVPSATLTTPLTTLTTPTVAPVTTAIPTPSLSPPSLSLSSSSTQPSPSVIVNNSRSTGRGEASAAPTPGGALSSRSSLPSGAIVGIAIGAVLLLLLIVVLLVRNRFKRSRKTKRATWLTKGGISGPVPAMGDAGLGEPVVGGSPYMQSRDADFNAPLATGPASLTRYPSSLRPGYTPGEASPDGPFSRAQSEALAARVAPPPMSFNNPPPVPVQLPSPRPSPRTAIPQDMVTVKFTFIPSLPDELTISNGEIIRVVQDYDDGWALCENGRNQRGMVPVECFERIGGSSLEANADRLGDMPSFSGTVRNSRRASSLNARR